ncbi:MAG TPA: methyltransferase domain-containing protein, partial [Methylomirabilota bacterium]|nr:methyltransferase domain-containing protein [Methylomirabilota bacterium]
MAGDRAPVSTSAFWEKLYAAGQDGWELGEPAPALVQRLEAGLPLAPGTRVAVPGAGRGHDARLLARRGYQVTGFDFAEAAVREARRLAEEEGVRVAFERRDVFSLAADYTEAFDAVWEYTCFCAIDPARRGEYVDVLHDVLRPGGLLFGCFYPLREGTDGPPFPVSREGIEADLAPRFDLLESAPPA